MVAGRIFNTIFRIVLPLFASAIFLSGCGLDPGIQGTIGSSNKPIITVSDLTLNEGASGHLVLTSSIALPKELIVNYSTTSVTASAGVDYTAVSDSLTIAAGSVSASIAIVLPVTDGVYEGTETFSVAFSAPPSVNLLNLSKVVTILDLDLPDQAPVLDVIADQTVNENIPILAVDAADGFDDFDVDGDAITYSCWYDVVSDGTVAETTLCSSLTGVSFVSGTGVFSWTPDLTQAGLYEFMIKGSEGDLSDTEIFVVTVVDVEPFVWTGASGIDNNWSRATNWSSLTVPGPTDLAKFKNACSGAQCNVTVDVSFDVLGIDMQATYTGTITQAAGLTPVIGASGWTQAGGTYLSPSGGNMDLTGNIVIAGGAFGPTCPRVRMHTGVTLIQAVPGGWACSGSTVQGWGTGSLTVDVAGGDFRVFRYNRNPPADLNIVGTLRLGWLDGAIAGNAWNGGVIELHSEGISGGASINGGTATIRIVDDRPTGITGNAGGTLILPNVEIARSGTVNNFSFGNKILIAGNLTYTSGNFDPATSTVVFSGANNQTINLGSKSLNNVEFQKTAGTANIIGTLDINGNLIVNNTGTADAVGGVSLAGDYTLTANGSAGPSVRFDGSGVQLLTSSLALGSMIIDKASGRISQSSHVALDAGLDVAFAQSGIWDMNGYNLTADVIDAGAATGTIYKDCGNLVYNSLAGTVQVYDGTYGSTISIADAVDVTENDLTDVNQEFVVSVSPVNCVATTFDYATTDGTAASPADYTAVVGASATVPANTSSVTLSVLTKFDDLVEANENYTVILSNILLGVSSLDLVGQGVILNDDVAPINDVTISALLSSGITSDDFSVQVTFVGDNDNDSVITLYWCNAWIAPGCDPEVSNSPQQGSVIMTRGTGVYTANVANLVYPNYAGDELNLRVVAVDADGTSGGPLNATIQLLPVLDIGETAKLEGQNLEFFVSLNQSYSSDVVFTYISSDVTASAGAGNDYVSIGGTATIFAGQTKVALPVVVNNDDGLNEPTETFNVTISSPTNATIRTAAALGRIVDNDPGASPGAGLNGAVYEIAVQSDNKRIVSGNFTQWDDNLNVRLVRTNADGSEDKSFNIGSGFDNDVMKIVRQYDGKYLIGGKFSVFNGTSRSAIVRLNSDGSIDTAFAATGAGATGSWYEVDAIVQQRDGKIVIGGDFTSYNGTARNRLARINLDGTIDTTFTVGTGANNYINDLEILRDGRIYIGGKFLTYASVSRARVARVNRDGSLDTTFVPGVGADGDVNALAVQSDGKMLIAGSFVNYNSVAQARIARINMDGSLDTSFSVGTGLDSYALDMQVLPNGQIFLVGPFWGYNSVGVNGLVLLNANGSRDTSFVSGVPNNTTRSVSLQSDGKYIIAGSFGTYSGATRNRFARINTNGALDVTFDNGTGANDHAYSTHIDVDGRVLVGGAFVGSNGISRNRIARLNQDNSLDTSFDPGVGFNSTGLAYAIKIQSDNKIVLGGSFTSYNGTSRNRIVRVNADGSIDTSFAPGTGASDYVYSILIDTDGKIIIGGQFLTYNSTARARLARLNSNGTLDATFNPGAGADAFVADVVRQADGKYIIGGNFLNYDSTGRVRIARINSDGTLDTSFNPGTGVTGGNVDVVRIQPDGKLMATGTFSAYTGTTRHKIVRINADGTLDASFDPGTGVQFGQLHDMEILADGKIVIAGQFSIYNGTTRNQIARILTTGSLDTTFNGGSGTGSSVDALGVSTLGEYIIGGSFTSFSGASVSYLTSFSSTASLSVGNLRFANQTSSSFEAALGYHGDTDEDSTAVLYYCDHTATPGCDPLLGNSAVMSAASGIYNGDFTVLINSGLVSGHTYNVRVVATDPDGVMGTPVDQTVTLP